MEYHDLTPIIGNILETYPGNRIREAAFWCGIVLEMSAREERIMYLIDNGNGEC